MFWEWYYELYTETFGSVQPCPSCILWPCSDCGYLIYDSYSAEYDCEAPEEDIDSCDGCKYLICDRCKE